MSSNYRDNSPKISWSEFVEALGKDVSATEAVDVFLAFSPYPGRMEAPPAADKWVLASNLHKSIRLGLVPEAIATAEALYRCDAVYFWQRLPIIALEDISFGDLRACAEVLIFARSPSLRRQFKGPALPGYLANRLARTIKCRSPCDLLSLVIAQQGEASFEAEINALGMQEALDAARTVALPWRNRVLALMRLDRLPIREGVRATRLQEVAASLGVPALVSELLVSGKGTLGMSSPLPLIFEMLGMDPLQIKTTETGLVGEVLEGPILCSALEKHTRSGLKAISLWIHSIAELSHFFAERGLTHSADKVVRMGLFQSESSVLNIRLTNDTLDKLLEETEWSEMQMVGLRLPEDATRLYALMRKHHPVLNEIRRTLWAG